MNPLISLIIPVYNVEGYLGRCIQSVLNQTYENYEIVLVDDGSTDSSGIMCDEYAAKDDRVRVLHKPNGGLSDARNHGIERAKGELISFIDSDDFVTKDYLEYLYYLMEKYNADISSAGYIRVEENSYNFDQKQLADVNLYKHREDYCVNTKDAIEQLLRAVDVGTSACIKLYRREVLLKYPFPVGKQPEDVAVIYKIFAESQKIAIGRKRIYFYLQRAESYVHGNCSAKKTNDMIEIAEEMVAYINTYFPKSVQAAHIRCAFLLAEYLPPTFYDSHRGKEFFLELREFIKPYVGSIIKSKSRVALKMFCASVIFGYTPAKMFWSVKNMIKFIRLGADYGKGKVL